MVCKFLFENEPSWQIGTVKLDLVGYDQTTEIVETVTDPKIVSVKPKSLWVTSTNKGSPIKIEKTGMKLEEDPKQPVKLEDLRLSFAHELQPSKWL